MITPKQVKLNQIYKIPTPFRNSGLLRDVIKLILTSVEKNMNLKSSKHLSNVIEA